MKIKMIILGMLAMAVLPIFGQGYGLYEQGGGFGNLGAYVARAEDSSALYHNPAGLALLTSSEVALHGRGLFSQSFYSNPGQSTWDSDTAIDGAPTFFSNFTAGKFAFGLGAVLTHHYNLDWDEPDFPARYLGNKHEVIAYEAMGGVSFRFNDYFSMGATFRQANLEISNSRLLPRPIPGFADPFETEETIDVDGTGTGFSVGFLYFKPRRFSVGLTYWSPIEVDLDGTRNYSLHAPLNDSRAENAFSSVFGNSLDAPALSTFELPERFAVGFQTKITVRTRLEVDLSSEQWSSVDTLAYNTSDALGQPQQVIYPRAWEDTFSYRIAGDFQQRKAILWRAALGGTDAVVPEETLGPDFPDYQRFMYSFGLSYTMRKKYVLELGWTYIQNRDRPVQDQELFFDPTSPNFYTTNSQDGVYETQRMQVNLGLRILFGKTRKPPER